MDGKVPECFFFFCNFPLNTFIFWFYSFMKNNKENCVPLFVMRTPLEGSINARRNNSNHGCICVNDAY